MTSLSAGMLALLDEEDATLKSHALGALNQNVDSLWSEIAGSIVTIESLVDDDSFKDRELAAVVASKVFYHLEEFDEALKYALQAGSLFNLSAENEYVQTLVSKCIEEYIKARTATLDQADAKIGSDATDQELDMDKDLVKVIERMFESCFFKGHYKQALGIAVESRRLDIVTKAIKDCPDMADMLAYCFGLSQTVITSRRFRQEILRQLVQLYSGLTQPDYVSMCQCLLFLDDAERVADVLAKLIISEKQSDFLYALQVAFDLTQNQYTSFMNKVVNALPSPEASMSDEEKAAVVAMYERTIETKKAEKKIV